MAHVTALSTRHQPASSLRQRLAATLHRAWATYQVHRAERETIRSLHALDGRTLKDIGLDRSEIESVAHSPERERRLAVETRARRLSRLGMCA